VAEALSCAREAPLPKKMLALNPLITRIRTPCHRILPRLFSSAIPEAHIQKVVSAVERHIPGIDTTSLQVDRAGAGQVAVSQSMFKVTSPSAKYGVKLLAESAVGVDLSKFVDGREASMIMSAAGLTPKILGWDDAAIVREFVGKVVILSRLNGVEDFQRLAKAVAKLHALECPTEWIQIPSTAKAGMAPFFQHIIGSTEDDEVKTLFADALEFMQRLPDNSGILGRTVLTHSDAKPANMVRVDDDFLFIDLDMVALRPAFYDLTYIMFMWGGTSGDLVLDPSQPGSWFQQPEIREAFAKSYLESSGLPANETDVEDFLFELESYAPQMMLYYGFVSHWLGMNPALPDSIKPLIAGLRRAYLTKVYRVHEEIQGAAASDARRREIAANGVLSIFRNP